MAGRKTVECPYYAGFNRWSHKCPLDACGPVPCRRVSDPSKARVRDNYGPVQPFDGTHPHDYYLTHYRGEELVPAPIVRLERYTATRAIIWIRTPNGDLVRTAVNPGRLKWCEGAGSEA